MLTLLNIKFISVRRYLFETYEFEKVTHLSKSKQSFVQQKVIKYLRLKQMTPTQNHLKI